MPIPNTKSPTTSKVAHGCLELSYALDQKVQFEHQIKACAITPKSKTTESEPVMNGQAVPGTQTTEWTLDFNAIQDFTNPEGLCLWSWAQDGNVVGFTWTPNGEKGPKYTGQCMVVPLTHGGDVGKVLDDKVSWSIIGKPAVVMQA